MTLRIDISLQRPGFALSLTTDLPLRGLTVVHGPSGAGKSTLLRCIAGFERPEGQIVFGDEVWCGPRQFLPPHRRRIATVFQDPRLFGHLDVAGNLAYAARRAPTRADVAQVVDYLDLAPLLPRRVGGLSGGEAQRVALARALLSNPRLLMMDEPLAALDLQRRAEILPYVERLRDEAHLPILYVSHSFAEVARLATHVVSIDKGSLVAAGPADTLLPRIAGLLPGDEAQSVISATVRARTADGLTELRFPGGAILTPETLGPLGTNVRLSVRARDVMLSLSRPEGLSALNILPATVTDILPEGVSATVVLSLAGTPLLARVTARSVTALGLRPGLACHAILKSVALIRV